MHEEHAISRTGQLSIRISSITFVEWKLIVDVELFFRVVAKPFFTQ
jgi:hypothetical protein